MAGFCLTGDIFDLFVWFELMGVSAYALTAYRPEERGPVQGALNFAITNSIGAYLSLSGIGLIYGRTGALNMAQIGRDITRHRPDGLVVVAFVLILMGLLIKSAIVPFRFWLADAHAVAPTPVCVLFSGVDAGGGELFGWFGGGGHGVDGQLDDRGQRQAARGERVEDGVAETALGPVVLGRDKAAGFVGGVPQRGGVDGLDRIRVDDAGGDALVSERVRGGERLVHGDARGHNGDLVAGRGAQHVAAADRELLVATVDDRGLAAGGAQVGNAGQVRHRRRQAGRLVGVAGIQHGAAVHGAQRLKLEKYYRGSTSAKHVFG